MPRREQLRRPTKTSRILDMNPDQLCLKTIIVLPSGKELATSRILTRHDAATLLPDSMHGDTLFAHKQRKVLNLRRQQLVTLLSEEIASQFTQVLDTADTINGMPISAWTELAEEP